MNRGKQEACKQLREWGKDIIIATLIVLVLTTFFIQNKRVVGSSMSPTLENNQMVIINKFVYRWSEPKRGDIIGFTVPFKHEKVVKRIVGLPGDKIDYNEGTLYLNDRPINDKETYYANKRGDITYPYIVPEGYYFVIGDNLNHSIDSRYETIGRVYKDNIIGRIDLKIWPFWNNPLLNTKD